MGPHHCGMNPGPGGQAVRYTLELTCTSTSLDQRGFLFDQAGVDKWIAEYTASRLAREASCEGLADGVLEYIRAHIRRENPQCVVTHGSMKISPYPYKAAVTCSWTAPKASRAVGMAGGVRAW